MLSSYIYVFSLIFLPLAEATAAGFAGPIFLAALAGPLLGEKVGPRRLSLMAMIALGAVVVEMGG